MTDQVLLEFKNIEKKFDQEGVTFTALQGINLQVYAGEFLGLYGKSGSGKSTLLSLAGLIDTPTKGELHYRNINVGKLNDVDLSQLRAQDIGFIFQTFNLLPLLTAYENVEYPLMLLGLSETERKVKVLEALDKVELLAFQEHRPGQLSGGQRQRVAFARAIVKKPKLILADEPTANLDSANSQAIFNLLLKLQKEMKVTVILCTHDDDLIRQTSRQIKLLDGKIVL
jgi:putative ABC transport system ATP-binding protein